MKEYPYKTSRPIEGDMIFGMEEFIIGRKKKNEEDVIEVGMRLKKCYEHVSRTETIFSKGKMIQFPVNTTYDHSSVNKNRMESLWMVEKVLYRESLQLLHSVLPESYFVRAVKITDNRYDKDKTPETIEFYTCGHPQMHDNIITTPIDVIGNIHEDIKNGRIK